MSGHGDVPPRARGAPAGGRSEEPPHIFEKFDLRSAAGQDELETDARDFTDPRKTQVQVEWLRLARIPFKT